MIRVITTDVHAIFLRPKISRIFSENGDCGKWWRIMGCSMAIGPLDAGPLSARPPIAGAGSTVFLQPEASNCSRALWRGARLRPGQQRVKSGTQLLSPLREAIFHLRRYLMVDD